MRRTLTLCRAGMAGAAAVVLLTACGGGDAGESAPASPAKPADESVAASSPASGADDPFCAEAAAVEEQVTTALTGVADDPVALVQALTATAGQVRAVQAPAEIAADWNALAGGLEQLAAVFTTLDLDDPNALATLEEQVGQIESGLAGSGTNVENYLRAECGMEPDVADPGALGN